MNDHYIMDSIGTILRSATSAFAMKAEKLTAAASWSPELPFEHHHKIENIRVMEQTVGAVMTAVATSEGMINEVLSGAANRSALRSRTIGNVPENVYTRWGRLWDQGAFKRGSNALEKCQLALSIADLPPLEKGSRSVESMAALILLRNSLVHSEPRFRRHGADVPQKDRDSLERRLTGKFTDNELVRKEAPYIWQRCLGAGCARWSVATMFAFQNEFFEALGIEIQADVRWG